MINRICSAIEPYIKNSRAPRPLLAQLAALRALYLHTQAIDLLLEAIKDGNPKNRPTLAGLLIRALQ